MALLTLRETAERLLCSPHMLYNKPFREMLGLRAVRSVHALGLMKEISNR